MPLDDLNDRLTVIFKGCGLAHRQIMRRMRLKSNYKGIPAQYASKIERILDRLDAAKEPEDMDLPGYKFHLLRGIVWVLMRYL